MRAMFRTRAHKGQPPDKKYMYHTGKCGWRLSVSRSAGGSIQGYVRVGIPTVHVSVLVNIYLHVAMLDLHVGR